MSVHDFAYWWGLEGRWVEEPNERRDGTSGVQFLPASEPGSPSLYSKRQLNHCYRSLRYPLGRPTVFREQQAIMALNRLGIRTPVIVFCDAVKAEGQWRAVLVTEELAGFISLEEWYTSEAAKEAGLKQQVLEKTAHMLAIMHGAGLQHSCCYAKHIFVKTDSATQTVEVALLDLEKLRRRWPARSAALHDLAQLYRHKEGMPDTDWNVLVDAYCAAGAPIRAADCQRLKK